MHTYRNSPLDTATNT